VVFFLASYMRATIAKITPPTRRMTQVAKVHQS
jgi:hypothetical protein